MLQPDVFWEYTMQQNATAELTVLPRPPSWFKGDCFAVGGRGRDGKGG